MNYFLEAILLIFLYMTSVFVIALLKRDNSVVDTAWGLGFILVAIFTLVRNGTFLVRHILATSLVLIWGFRLAWHIYTRNRGRGEDFRYKAWREKWGQLFIIRSFFQIFMLQGFFLLLIASSVIYINNSNLSGLTLLDIAGLIIWTFAFIFEAIGDKQLKIFKSDPANKGKIMQSGLWSYTRHPNYFGESLQWWGIFIISLSLSNGWLTVISPITITFLLVKVSGIPMLEKKYSDNPEFQAYKQRTNAFIPWFPKNS